MFRRVVRCRLCRYAEQCAQGWARHPLPTVSVISSTSRVLASPLGRACSGSLQGLDLAYRYVQSRDIDAAIVAPSDLYLSPEHLIGASSVGRAYSVRLILSERGFPFPDCVRSHEAFQIPTHPLIPQVCQKSNAKSDILIPSSLRYVTLLTSPLMDM